MKKDVLAVSDFEVLTTPLEVSPDRNPAMVYLATLGSQNSRESMLWCLNLAASILTNGEFDGFNLHWSQMRYPHLAALKARLLQPFHRNGATRTYSFSTINLILSAIRGVVKECWKLEQISDSDYMRLISEKGIRGESGMTGRSISLIEKTKLFQACEDDKNVVAGIRDGAILAVMMGGGLRRAEVSDLDIDDWQEQNSLIVVRRGKGRRYREVPVGTVVHDAVCDWLSLREGEPGPIFLHVHKSGKIGFRRLKPEGVYTIILKRMEQAQIDPISPHDLRRTYITDLLEADIDLARVSKLAGHANVATTARYDKRGQESLREAAETLELPYRPRRKR
jgi:integrase